MSNKLTKFAAPPPKPKNKPGLGAAPSPKNNGQNKKPIGNKPINNSSVVSVMQNKLKDFASVVSNNLNENVVISSQLPTKDNLSSMAQYILSNLKADAQWGEKTNNSLSFAYKIIYALVVSNNYFKLNVGEYTPQYLNNLKLLLDASKINDKTKRVDLDEKTKNEYADYISAHINQAILFYNEIIKKINQDSKINLNQDLKYLDVDTLFKSNDALNFVSRIPAEGFDKEYKLDNNLVYINSQELGNYLNNVAQQAKSNSDKVLGSLVNKLIIQTKPLTNNSAQPVTVTYQDEITDDKVLFNVDLTRFGGANSVPLTIKDISNRFNFNKWVDDNKISDVRVSSSTLSGLLNTLKETLNDLDASAKEQYLSDMYQHGIKLINNLLSNIQINKPESVENKTNPEMSSTIISSILQRLPLQNNVISKKHIDAFFDGLSKFGDTYSEYKNKVSEEFAKLNNLAQGSTFVLNQGVDNLYAQLKNPTPNNFNLLITSLLIIINQVSFAINEFKASKQKQINENESSLRNNFNSQTGSNNSAYAYNLHYLKDLRSKMEKAQKIQRGVK